MLRLLLGCFALCIIGGKSKPTEKRSRFVSHIQHDDKNFDHEAFLGPDDAKTFKQLPPEESRRRLGVIVDKIDTNGDGFVSEDELKLWIRRSQQKHVDDSVERQWGDFDLDQDGRITWDEYKNVTYSSFLDEPQTNSDYNYSQMLLRDERRFRVADRNGDLAADKHEFSAFLHPEHHGYMKDIVVQETIEDIDKNGDGFIDIKEYIGDMYNAEQGEQEPDWVENERQQFNEFRDKNNDGKMDKEETLDWILPSDYDHADAEAKHLLSESDVNKDGKLTKKEILDKYEVFVGSQVTDFGAALMQHDEF